MLIHSKPHMQQLTTLGLGGEAESLVCVETIRDLDVLLEKVTELGEPKVLGGGSNILAQDGQLPWVIVQNSWLNRPEVKLEGLVRISCAWSLPRFLAWCAKESWGGLAGLAGVPGQVGGAIAGNAGAMGQEVGNVWTKLGVYTPEAGLVEVSRSECQCGYRHFSLPAHMIKSWYLLVWVEFKLVKQSKVEILQLMHSNWQRKLSSQPMRAKSAGCIFKNPAGLVAGKLLDEVGFRGKGYGGVEFSKVHANFMVNKGHGQASAALDLIAEAQAMVRQREGVDLELEVKLWLY